MKLLEEVRKIEEELAAKASDLEVRKSTLDEREKNIESLRSELEVGRKDLDKARKDVEKRMETVRRDEELTALESSIRGDMVKINSEMGRLRKLENDLALVAQRQGQREKDLADREAVLSTEKEEYKAKLKAEFLDQVNKKLSGGL